MDHFYEDVFGWCGEDVRFVFTEAINRMPDRDAHFVEVGSFQGRSAVMMAVEIINSGKDIRFDCVDHFRGSVEHGNYLAQNSLSGDGKLYEAFLKNIKPVENYINPIRMPSVEAAEPYEDNSLDFVWIDADHSFEGSMLDLETWYPKVKRGGILAGHDYEIGRGCFDAVRKFVEKFGEEYDLLDHTYARRPLRVMRETGKPIGMLGQIAIGPLMSSFWMQKSEI